MTEREWFIKRAKANLLYARMSKSKEAKLEYLTIANNLITMARNPITHGSDEHSVKSYMKRHSEYDSIFKMLGF